MLDGSDVGSVDGELDGKSIGGRLGHGDEGRGEWDMQCKNKGEARVKLVGAE